MKKIIIISSIVAFVIALASSFNSCKPSEAILAKSGAQIWGENCVRCHNTADPSTFSDVEWDVASMHMQIRANLTADEIKKVTEFLQSAN
ncbi:MAG: cytochrome c [Vicingaceae bacterium]|nr:cytochrome c [Flavobacteriales bacterium]MDF1674723.1 cytochrome c [Vicingaceae bacterium]